MRIEILLYDGFDELDGIAPYEVLRTAEESGADLHAELVGARRRRDDHRVARHADPGRRAASSEAADMVLVPGGSWNSRGERGAWAEAQRGEVPATDQGGPWARRADRLRLHGRDAPRAAGITDGRPATTHHSAIEDLRAIGRPA